MKHVVIVGLMLIGLASKVSADETITYGYDARGRLITAASSGSGASNRTTSYGFDAADNRVSVTTTGSSLIVLPIGGLRVVPLASPGP